MIDPRDRGIALPAVLFVLLGLVVTSATLFLTVFLDVAGGTNDVAGDDALYVAEAGVQRLWTLLDPAPDFAAALAWPEGAPPIGSPSWFPRPPRTYRIRVAAGPASDLVASVEGTSRRGARRRVEARFRRDPVFHPLAALVTSGGAAADGTLDLSGADRDAAEPSLPALGAETCAAAASWTAGGGPSPVVTGKSGLAEAASALGPSADRTVTGPLSDADFGSDAAPEVVRFAGDARVEGVVRVSGIAIADAPLVVHGRLEIHGLFLAAAGAEVRGEVAVAGAAWIAEGLRVAPGASLGIRYASRHLARADASRPRILPRQALLGAWREVW